MEKYFLPSMVATSILVLSACESSISHNEALDELSQVKQRPECQAVFTSDGEKQTALLEMNKIRSIHGLEPVEYNANNDVYTEASALINAAEGKLDHHPKSSFKCYTNAGYKGSSNSNLFIIKSSPRIAQSNNSKLAILALQALIIDENVESLGHRAWLLNPFLKTISYGSASLTRDKVYDAASVYVFDSKDSLTQTNVDYVAYPYQNYPKDWFVPGWYSSFSVIENKGDSYDNQGVDYSDTTVTVTDEQGNSLKVSDIKFTQANSNSYFGIGNLLQWKIENTSTHKKYFVKIKNVKVKSQSKDYAYWFTLQ